jgi:steroid 5-alpha reductase family enzyme
MTITLLPVSELATTWLLGWVALLACGLALWGWSLWRRDASVVDIWWGLFFGGLTWWYRWRGPETEWFHIAHLALVTVWGLRLALHIAWRGRGKGEDPRYAAMRAAHGPRFAWVSLGTVFWLQATLAALLAAPLLAVQSAQPARGISPVAFAAGALLWAAGFLCEAAADWQLLRFQRDPASRGKVLDSGLWRYSRHPNYFGEALLWWGYGVLAAGAGGWWALFAPLAMTWLLLRVSGVTLLEKTIVHRRPEYESYIRRTSAFVPWPPREGGDEGAHR